MEAVDVARLDEANSRLEQQPSRRNREDKTPKLHVGQQLAAGDRVDRHESTATKPANAKIGSHRMSSRVSQTPARSYADDYRGATDDVSGSG